MRPPDRPLGALYRRQSHRSSYHCFDVWRRGEKLLHYKTYINHFSPVLCIGHLKIAYAYYIFSSILVLLVYFDANTFILLLK